MATSKSHQKPLTNKLEIMLKKILPFLMRQETARPFLRPVDHVAFELPDYPVIIKSPMDLSTIKERLIRKFYETFAKCLQDFLLMLENCYIYNSPEDPIVSMGLRLKHFLFVKLQFMPSIEYRVKRVKGRGLVPSRNIRRLKRNLNGKNVLKSKIDSERNKIFSANITMSDSDFEKCLMLLNELTSIKYKSINYLFLKPVDALGLDLADYCEFVKYPIDLSTIKVYLESRLYETRTAFTNDIYLMLNNCIIYNGRDTEIGIICRRFQADFENLYFSIFQEKCRENINDEAFYFLMKIKRKHKEIEEMIRLNTEGISIARSRIDMIVSLFESNDLNLREERKRKMLIKIPNFYSSNSSTNSVKKVKSRLKENSLKTKSDAYL